MKLSDYILQFSTKTFPIYYDAHETDYFHYKQKIWYENYLKAPTYRELLIQAQKDLSDAEWVDDQEKIKKLKEEIYWINAHIECGELKPVNF
jgi:hypothetical protein